MPTPVIDSLRWPTTPEATPTSVQIQGRNFIATSTVTISGVPPTTTTFVNDGRIDIVIPEQTVGLKPIQVTNPIDGAKSNIVDLVVQGLKSALGRTRNPRLNMRTQPLPAPRRSRTDSQRIAAGQQFTGDLPDVVNQGFWKDGGVAPTRGGVWRYNDAVLIEEIEFVSDGAEPAPGRDATSRIEVIHSDGSPKLLIVLSGIDVNKRLSGLERFILEQNEEIRAFTGGATKEMTISVTVATTRPRSLTI